MKRDTKTLDGISVSTTRYCDLITDEESAENLAWAEFAAMQFPDHEGEHFRAAKPQRAQQQRHSGRRTHAQPPAKACVRSAADDKTTR
jgi:hypothetical protein